MLFRSSAAIQSCNTAAKVEAEPRAYSPSRCASQLSDARRLDLASRLLRLRPSRGTPWALEHFPRVRVSSFPSSVYRSCEDRAPVRETQRQRPPPSNRWMKLRPPLEPSRAARLGRQKFPLPFVELVALVCLIGSVTRNGDLEISGQTRTTQGRPGVWRTRNRRRKSRARRLSWW